MARATWIAVLAAGLAVGAFSLAVARDAPAYSYGGGSTFAGAAELVAGYALLAVGLTALGRRQARVGELLVAASFAWFLLEWNNPRTGSAFVFTVGLTLYVAAPPLVAHAVFAYPSGRLSGWPERVGVASAYAGAVIVLGLLAAALFDPAAEDCAQCPHNFLLVHGSRSAYADVNRVGVDLGLAWALLLALLAAAALVRANPVRRRVTAPVLAAGAAYLALVAAEFAHSTGRGFLDTDTLDRRLWLAQAGVLCALALAVVSGWVRARRTRSEVARLVLELAESPPAGGLRDALASKLGDDTLELAYPVGDRLLDGRGRSARLAGEVTPLVQAGKEVALLSHRPGLLDDPALVEEVAAAARLALENERLQAETRFQLEELRASRMRIIEMGDAERRRLERDLHDGAQQRLVALALDLRLARSRLGVQPDPVELARVDEAEGQLRLALAELRELARGIFPAVLAEEGLTAALEALEEESPGRIGLTSVAASRVGSAAEAAAYFVVAETLRCDPAYRHDVAVAQQDGHLVVEVDGARPPASVVALQDRVGALDGSVRILSRGSGRVTVRAEIPCGS